MSVDVGRKALKRAAGERPRRMGVYQIRNLTNEKVLVGGTLNLDAIFHRHEFELRNGRHRNTLLQKEWDQFGSDNFVFEVLDELSPTDPTDHDYRADVELLEKVWLAKIQPYGEAGYNPRKLDESELLRSIATRRNKNV
jgi:hypothetical protein